MHTRKQWGAEGVLYLMKIREECQHQKNMNVARDKKRGSSKSSRKITTFSHRKERKRSRKLPLWWLRQTNVVRERWLDKREVCTTHSVRRTNSKSWRMTKDSQWCIARSTECFQRNHDRSELRIWQEWFRQTTTTFLRSGSRRAERTTDGRRREKRIQALIQKSKRMGTIFGNVETGDGTGPRHQSRLNKNEETKIARQRRRSQVGRLEICKITVRGERWSTLL